jgi:LysR family hydrogen peroxide-inducible transcriptional activator
MAGAAERRGFRATSLETLRQMVAAGVGVTLLPKMSVSPPVPENAGVQTIRFVAPAPNRQIAMFWRRSSVHTELLADLATVFTELPDELLLS